MEFEEQAQQARREMSPQNTGSSCGGRQGIDCMHQISNKQKKENQFSTNSKTKQEIEHTPIVYRRGTQGTSRGYVTDQANLCAHSEEEENPLG